MSDRDCNTVISAQMGVIAEGFHEQRVPQSSLYLASTIENPRANTNRCFVTARTEPLTSHDGFLFLHVCIQLLFQVFCFLPEGPLVHWSGAGSRKDISIGTLDAMSCYEKGQRQMKGIFYTT